jgi:peptidoglycan/LPS O-acetylase OafA/YrhL
MEPHITTSIAGPMKRGTSLYLDLVRFSAAFMVFLEHVRLHTWHSFGTFWNAHPFLGSYLPPASQTAVIVFFVLSGYVIAHVLATRERTPLEYAASRIARLYSVVVPALVLVAASNYIEEAKYPGLYAGFHANGGAIEGLYYFGTALFVNSFWLFPDLSPPNAWPFWSLSFEASYYVGIALVIFARGRTRILSLILLGLVAGPTIVLLAPTWLAGFGAYHFSQRQRIRIWPAILVWMTATCLLFMCPFIQAHFRAPISFLRLPPGTRTLGGLLAIYAASICFTLSLLAFDASSDKLKQLLLPLAGPIRWLGSLTFALYLFHYPLLSFFNVYSVGGPPYLRIVMIVGGTTLVVAIAGPFCEQSKNAYKRSFMSIWKRAVPSSSA